MSRWLADLGYGVRTLRKSPGFTAVAIWTLALGLGASTVIFSLLNGLFLHPPGLADPGHLLVVRAKYDKLNLKSIPISAPDFQDVLESKQVFSAVAAEEEQGFNYQSPRGPVRVRGARVTWQWFDAFGTRPALGRVFRPEEDQPHANHVVLLADGTWKSLFGGDPAVLGRAIRLNGEDYRVVGVMPPEFEWPRRTQLWVPLALTPPEFAPNNYFNEFLFVVARARPGFSAAQAQAYVRMLSQKVLHTPRAGDFARDSGWGMFALPFTEYASGDLRMPMLMLMGAVSFVLLIACLNIGGLLLARASARGKEYAIRLSLGAQKGDLLRQALAESFLLAACGAAAGVAAACGGLSLLAHPQPGTLLSRLLLRVDGHVLLFALILMVLCAAFLGVIPVGEVFRHQQFALLKEESGTVTAAGSRLRLRSGLVVGQIALAFVLVAGAGLLIKSLTRLGRVDPGFDPACVATATLQLPENRYNSDQKLVAFYDAVGEKLAALPGVSAVGMGVPPFSGLAPSSSFSIEGRPAGPGDPGPHSGLNWVTPGYFETLRIPLKAGRYFTKGDRLGSQPVVIIDENLARQYWPNQDPLGQRVRHSRNSSWATIVGVVGHVMQSGLVGDSGKGVCYYPLLQVPLPETFLLVRTPAPHALSRALQAAVASVDPAQPVADFRTMEQYVADSLAPQHLAASLLEIFSALALFLSALGLYGVVSYNTTQRTHEIGIRIALGARRPDVLKLVVGQGLRLALLGVVAGGITAVWLAQWLRSQLFEVSPLDASALFMACFTLLGVTLAASFLPAWRAARVDPMVALRYE
jgi:predicted permease